MQDDPILAELRQVRKEMLAEFPTDEALFRALKAHEAEQIKKGKTVASPATHSQAPRKPNAA
jgi:hypothetical protein